MPDSDLIYDFMILDKGDNRHPIKIILTESIIEGLSLRINTR